MHVQTVLLQETTGTCSNPQPMFCNENSNGEQKLMVIEHGLGRILIKTCYALPQSTSYP